MMDLYVEFVYVWVRGGRGAESVFFDNESFIDFTEDGYHVRDVPWRMWCFAEEFRILRNWS